MSLADEVGNTVASSIGPTLGKGIINGCYRHMGITRDELSRENINRFIEVLGSSLPYLVGNQAASALIDKLKKEVEEMV